MKPGKLLSILLALCLVLGLMPVTAFADEGDAGGTATITVSRYVSGTLLERTIESTPFGDRTQAYVRFDADLYENVRFFAVEAGNEPTAATKRKTADTQVPATGENTFRVVDWNDAGDPGSWVSESGYTDGYIYWDADSGLMSYFWPESKYSYYAYTWKDIPLYEHEATAPAYDAETGTYTNGNDRYFTDAEGSCYLYDSETDSYNEVSASETVVPYFTYANNGGNAQVTGMNGADAVIVIPDTVPEDYPDESLRGRDVTAIDTEAFRYKDCLTSVTMGDNIDTIRMGAFAECTNLEEVIVGSSLNYIGEAAFNTCSALAKFQTTSENNVNIAMNGTEFDPFRFTSDRLTLYCPHYAPIRRAFEEGYQQHKTYVEYISGHSLSISDIDAYRCEWDLGDPANPQASFIMFCCYTGESCNYSLDVPADAITSKREPANCAQEGEIIYTATLDYDLDEDGTVETYTATKSVSDSAGSHSFGEPVFNWAEDHSACTVIFTCSVCNVSRTPDAEVVMEYVEPTLASEGSRTYTATYVDEDGTEYTDVYTETIPKLDHIYEKHTAVLPTYDAETDTYTNGNIEYYTCDDCGGYFTYDSANDSYTETTEAAVAVPYFRINENNQQVVRIMSYNGADAEITVPDTVPDNYPDEAIRGKAITAINQSAFRDNTTITKVVMGDNITHIGWEAFRRATNLEEIVIGSGLSQMDSSAFYNCPALRKFTCTATADNIGVVRYVFDDVSDIVFYGMHSGSFRTAVKSASFALDGTKTFIGLDAHGDPTWTWAEDFSSAAVTFDPCPNCSYRDTIEATVTSEITTPATIAAEGTRTYTATATDENGCEYTDEVTAPVPKPEPVQHPAVIPTYDAATDTYTNGNIEYYTCEGYDGYFKYNSGNDTYTEITENDIVLPYFRINENDQQVVRIMSYNGADAEITVPDTVPDNYPVEAIRGKAITSINQSAFRDNTTVTKVVMGDNITHIGWEAFRRATNLEEIVIGTGLRKMDSSAFYNCPALRKFTCTATADRITAVQYVFDDTSNVVFYGMHSGSFRSVVNGFAFAESETRTYIGLDAHRGPAWTWADDFSSATATFDPCTICAYRGSFETTTITSEVTTPPTTTTEGVRTYTATAVDEKGYEYTGEATEPIPMLDATVTVSYRKLDGGTETVTAKRIDSNTTTLTGGWYAVCEDVTVGGRMEIRDESGSGSSISIGGNETVTEVNLILCDGVTLTASGGIDVEGNESLTIWGQEDGDGKLAATGTDRSAAIGAFQNYSGEIIINGGTVEATGGNSAAGIGGGMNGTGHVTINAGTVTATGSGSYAAGIGGGGSDELNHHNGIGAGAQVTINGGTVTATGSTNGAGIGCSSAYTSGNASVTINGGKVTAIAGPDGAGIETAGGTVSLAWTNYDDDSITADSYTGTVTLVKDFTDGTEIYAAGEDVDNADIAGKTLTPAICYTVTFTPGAGSGESFTKTVVAGESFDLPGCDFTGMAGTTFAGWLIGGETLQPDVSYTPMRNVTATALWELPYIDADGNDMTPITVYTKVDADTTEMKESVTNGWYVVGGETVSNNNRIKVTGTVNLILCDGAVLNIPKGIFVDVGTTLVIWQQRGDTRGQIQAKSETKQQAAIGGNFSFNDEYGCGTIIINGGYIRAVGYSNSDVNGAAAAIGGGYSDRDNAGGTIIINGGSVSAVGGTKSAGIGGGYKSTGGDITINGGEVSAYGGDYAAGIGGGYMADGGIITINGGTVYGKGGYTGAGIGGGGYGGAGTITITGGDIVAEGERGAGIGDCDGNCFSNNGTVTLSWTEESYESMRVYAQSFIGAVTLEKAFKNEENVEEIFVPGDYTGNYSIDAKTLIPEEYETKPEFMIHSLVLSGKIGVNFFLKLPEIDGVDYEDSYMEFIVSGKGGFTKEVPFDADFMNRSGEFYGFTCYVSAIQMADNIKAVFHYGDGLTVEEDYSIKEYIEALSADWGGLDATTKDLVMALADYGHYVQPYLSAAKGWNLGSDYAVMDRFYTDAFDIDAITSAVAGYAITRENNGADIEKATFSLALDSGTDIMVYFKPAEGYTGKFTFTVDGETYKAKKRSDGRYLVKVTGISAHQLGDTHTIVATTASGSMTVTASALSYVQGMLAQSTDTAAQNAVAALYKYYEAAMAYKADH